MALTRDFKETIRARVERDPKYVLITGFVGGVLTYSLFF